MEDHGSVTHHPKVVFLNHPCVYKSDIVDSKVCGIVVSYKVVIGFNSS